MYKLVALIIAGFFAVLGLIFALQTYLILDDMKECGVNPQANSSQCAPADAIVAISGGDTTARAQTAIKLFKDGWAPVIIFSGAALDKTGPSNAAVMQEQALNSGVPQSAIITEEKSTDTQQNAAQVLVLAHSLKRIILVTSPYHQRRASREFTKAFGQTTTIINRPAYNDRQWPSLWFLTPDGWWLVISETVKTVAIP